METTEARNRIYKLLEIIPAKISELTAEELSFRRAPGKWSKKEIMGHLCDSAINNLIRFINAQYKPKPFAVHSYDQADCVKAGHYQEMPIDDILEFWKSVNRNIMNVISFYTHEQLNYECYMDEGEFGVYVAEEKPEYTSPAGKRTLCWLIDDYVAHMEYHLKQIIKY